MRLAGRVALSPVSLSRPGRSCAPHGLLRYNGADSFTARSLGDGGAVRGPAPRQERASMGIASAQHRDFARWLGVTARLTSVS